MMSTISASQFKRPRTQIATLRVGSKKFPAYLGANTIGRNKDAVINIKDLSVSQHHAILVITESDQHYICDLNSSNGTFSNDQEIVPFDLIKLENSDAIKFGAVESIYFKSKGPIDDSISPNENANHTQTFYEGETQILDRGVASALADAFDNFEDSIDRENRTFAATSTQITDLHEARTQIDIHEAETQVWPQKSSKKSVEIFEEICNTEEIVEHPEAQNAEEGNRLNNCTSCSCNEIEIEDINEAETQLLFASNKLDLHEAETQIWDSIAFSKSKLTTKTLTSGVFDPYEVETQKLPTDIPQIIEDHTYGKGTQHCEENVTENDNANSGETSSRKGMIDPHEARTQVHDLHEAETQIWSNVGISKRKSTTKTFGVFDPYEAETQKLQTDIPQAIEDDSYGKETQHCEQDVTENDDASSRKETIDFHEAKTQVHTSETPSESEEENSENLNDPDDPNERETQEIALLQKELLKELSKQGDVVQEENDSGSETDDDLLKLIDIKQVENLPESFNSNMSTNSQELTGTIAPVRLHNNYKNCILSSDDEDAVSEIFDLNKKNSFEPQSQSSLESSQADELIVPVRLSDRKHILSSSEDEEELEDTNRCAEGENIVDKKKREWRDSRSNIFMVSAETDPDTDLIPFSALNQESEKVAEPGGSAQQKTKIGLSSSLNMNNSTSENKNDDDKLIADKNNVSTNDLTALDDSGFIPATQEPNSNPRSKDLHSISKDENNVTQNTEENFSLGLSQLLNDSEIVTSMKENAAGNVFNDMEIEETILENSKIEADKETESPLPCDNLDSTAGNKGDTQQLNESSANNSVCDDEIYVLPTQKTNAQKVSTSICDDEDYILPTQKLQVEKTNTEGKGCNKTNSEIYHVPIENVPKPASRRSSTGSNIESVDEYSADTKLEALLTKENTEQSDESKKLENDRVVVNKSNRSVRYSLENFEIGARNESQTDSQANKKLPVNNSMSRSRLDVSEFSLNESSMSRINQKGSLDQSLAILEAKSVKTRRTSKSACQISDIVVRNRRSLTVAPTIEECDLSESSISLSSRIKRTPSSISLERKNVGTRVSVRRRPLKKNDEKIVQENSKCKKIEEDDEDRDAGDSLRIKEEVNSDHSEKSTKDLDETKKKSLKVKLIAMDLEKTKQHLKRDSQNSDGDVENNVANTKNITKKKSVASSRKTKDTEKSEPDLPKEQLIVDNTPQKIPVEENHGSGRPKRKARSIYARNSVETNSENSTKEPKSKKTNKTNVNNVTQNINLEKEKVGDQNKLKKIHSFKVQSEENVDNSKVDILSADPPNSKKTRLSRKRSESKDTNDTSDAGSSKPNSPKKVRNTKANKAVDKSNLANNKEQSTNQMNGSNNTISGRKRKSPSSKCDSDFSDIGETSPFKVPKISPDSPARNKRKQKPKVVFTMMDSPQLESQVRQLGGSMVDSIDACTVLVTQSVKRSRKLLTAIGQGKPICSPKWIKMSKKENTFLDMWDYIVEDKEAETKWDFSLKESLKRSRNSKLFEGLKFHIMVTSADDVLKGAIEACGGTIFSKKPNKSMGQVYAITSSENKTRVRKLMEQNSNLICIEPEAIFDGVLRQEKRFERHLIE